MSETMVPAAPSAATKTITTRYRETDVAGGRLQESPTHLLLRAWCSCYISPDEKVLSAIPGQQRERFVQDLNAIVVALGKLEAAELSGND